jgi:hypothetical protein
LREQLEEDPPPLGDLREQTPELLLGQRLDLLVLLRLPDALERQAHARGRVGANVPGLERVREQRLHRRQREPNRAGGDAALGDVPGEALDVRRLDRRQRHAGEERDRFPLEPPTVVGDRLRADAARRTPTVVVNPLERVIGEGDLLDGPILAALDVSRHLPFQPRAWADLGIHSSLVIRQVRSTSAVVGGVAIAGNVWNESYSVGVELKSSTVTRSTSSLTAASRGAEPTSGLVD